jgi:hypothetical protein
VQQAWPTSQSRLFKNFETHVRRVRGKHLMRDLHHGFWNTEDHGISRYPRNLICRVPRNSFSVCSSKPPQTARQDNGLKPTKSLFCSTLVHRCVCVHIYISLFCSTLVYRCVYIYTSDYPHRSTRHQNALPATNKHTPTSLRNSQAPSNHNRHTFLLK